MRLPNRGLRLRVSLLLRGIDGVTKMANDGDDYVYDDASGEEKGGKGHAYLANSVRVEPHTGGGGIFSAHLCRGREKP